MFAGFAQIIQEASCFLVLLRFRHSLFQILHLKYISVKDLKGNDLNKLRRSCLQVILTDRISADAIGFGNGVVGLSVLTALDDVIHGRLVVAHGAVAPGFAGTAVE